MKLVLTIMNKDDASIVMDALTAEKIQVTKMASTGGFLKSGSTTLIIGIEDIKVNKVVEIISTHSSRRQQASPTSTMSMSAEPLTSGILPFKVTIGGAIIFVLDVERFEKI